MGGTFLATGSKDNSVKIWELVETGCDFLLFSCGIHAFSLALSMGN
jgi:WD40 repeat protein